MILDIPNSGDERENKGFGHGGSRLRCLFDYMGPRLGILGEVFEES